LWIHFVEYLRLNSKALLFVIQEGVEQIRNNKVEQID